MSSITEKILSDFRLSDFFKIRDLRIRIVYTLFIIIVYRATLHVPLPCINASVMETVYQSSAFLSTFNVFTGGGLERFSIMSLGIAPNVSASIAVQLASTSIPFLKSLKQEGEAGQRILNQYTRYITILLTIIQGYGIAMYAEAITRPDVLLVIEKGYFFRFTTILSLLVGTLVMMWLGENITNRGIGQGSSVLIYAGIIASIPGNIMHVIDIGKNTSASIFFLTIAVVLFILCFIIFFERAYRPVHVIYARRERFAQSCCYNAYIPIKVNVSSVLPSIFSNIILTLPISLLNFFAEGNVISIFLYRYLSPGSTSLLFITSILIFCFAFLYAPIAFDTKSTSESLSQQHAYIQHIRPGNQTADYLQTILMRITFIGATYLLTISIAPDLLFSSMLQKIHISGTSFLIVVSITLDTVSQMYSYVTYNRYKGFKQLIRK